MSLEPTRAELATEVERLRRDRENQIAKRLTCLDSAIDELRKDMHVRFQNQADMAMTTKTENRRLTLQVFGTVLTATIGAAAVIIVALINSSPA